MIKEMLKISLIALLLLFTAQAASAYVISGNVSQATLTGPLPLDGATVDIKDLADNIVGTDTTVAGNYSITIPDVDGYYTFTIAYYSAYTLTIMPLANPITADTVIDFTLSAPMVTLSGTVKNLCGAPLAGVAISVKKGTGPLASTITDGAGAYSVDVIDGTTYDVTALAVGYISDTQSVPVAGAPVTQDFTLSAGCADADCDGFADASCGGTDCDDTSAAVNHGAAETCDGIDNDCSGAVDDGLVAPLNIANQEGACLGSTQACNGVAGWADDYTGILGYPDSCTAPAPPAAPAPAATGGGGGGGGGGGSRGDADCKPAPVGLGIGVSGWLCSANEACIGGITWNSPHVEGGVCCNIQCTAVAAVEEETPPQEEQPPAETTRETANPNCNDLNPCTVDTYDTVLEVCNNRAADNDTVCYANGQKGVCDFGACKVSTPAPTAPAVAAGPTGFAVFGDFFAAVSGAIGSFVQWILGLFG